MSLINPFPVTVETWTCLGRESQLGGPLVTIESDIRVQGSCRCPLKLSTKKRPMGISDPLVPAEQDWGFKNYLQTPKWLSSSDQSNLLDSSSLVEAC